MKKYNLTNYALTPQTPLEGPPGAWNVASIAMDGGVLYILWEEVEPIDVVLPTAFNVYRKSMASLLCREVKRVKAMTGTWKDRSRALGYLKDSLVALVDAAQMSDEQGNSVERHRHMVKMLIKHTYVVLQAMDYNEGLLSRMLLDIWDDAFADLTRPTDLLGSTPCTTSCTALAARLSPWLFNDPPS